LAFFSAAIVSVISIGIYFAYKQRSLKSSQTKLTQSSEIDKDETVEVNASQTGNCSNEVPDVEDVEDDEDDEDENDDVIDEEERQKNLNAELRAKYDDATRLANKLIQGNAYTRAIEKLTEALELGKFTNHFSIPYITHVLNILL